MLGGSEPSAKAPGYQAFRRASCGRGSAGGACIVCEDRTAERHRNREFIAVNPVYKRSGLSEKRQSMHVLLGIAYR